MFRTALFVLVASTTAFVQPALRTSSKLAASKVAPAQMMLEPAVAQTSQLLAGVVAVDGGTIGLEVSFGAFLAVILGLFIPVVFLITLYIQSEAQGTATTFRNPDSSGGERFDA
ncbi:MAG: photosystem II reaction center protein PsbM [Synechococcus sp. TMED187]|jgi:photosystem II PsbM protein|nr:MAG: photosystem II reaction center protein PsbM [Synechococcus sp. TMED187]|tara:strand:- start:161 stop:502 length:342 start_codon:yes stop_codon:yes gene_type:complete